MTGLSPAGCVAIDFVLINVEDCTGIDDLTHRFITVFPIPTQEYIWVKLNLLLDALDEVSLSDLSGRKLLVRLNQMENQYCINLNEYATGVLILSVRLKNGSVQHQKIMKQ